MRHLLLLLFVAAGLWPTETSAQDPQKIHNDCQAKLDDISSNISELNNEYEKIKGDLRAGLFCSKCGESKTELDKREGFYKHLGDVKGEAIPATQAQTNEAHQRYLGKFNSLKSNFESTKDNCNSQIQSANERQAEEQKAEREDAQQKAMDEAQDRERKQEDARRQAEQEAEDRRLAIIEANRQAQQALVDQIDRNTTTLTQIAQQAGNELMGKISNIDVLGGNGIGFDEKTSDSDLSMDEVDPLGRQQLDDDPVFDDLPRIDPAMEMIKGYANLPVNYYQGEFLKDMGESNAWVQMANKTNEWIDNFKHYNGMVDEVRNGEFGPEIQQEYLKRTIPNTIIQKIVSTNMGVINKLTSATEGVTERIGNAITGMMNNEDVEASLDFSVPTEQEVVKQLLPSVFTKPWTPKEVGKAILVGGVVVATGAPIWGSIGVAVIYAWKRH